MLMEEEDVISSQCFVVDNDEVEDEHRLPVGVTVNGVRSHFRMNRIVPYAHNAVMHSN